MIKSLFSKLFAAYLCIILLFSLFILFISFNAFRSYSLTVHTDNLQNLATVLLPRVTPHYLEGMFNELDAMVKNLGPGINTRITIVNSDGVVVADSEKDPRSMENHRFRPEILQVLEGERGASIRFSSTVKEMMLYVAVPIRDEQGIKGVLRVSLFLADFNRHFFRVRNIIIYSAIGLSLMALLAAFLISRSLSRPIRELRFAARRLAAGDLTSQVIIRDKGEIQDLAQSFNYMISQINKLFTSLADQRDQLHSVIASMQEGLLVFDGKGRITLCNESFKKIVQNSSMEGKYYWEVVRIPRFAELIKKLQKDAVSYSVEELSLYDSSYLCSISYLAEREETVVILSDITEMKRVETMKKDFVVNVSHELRTPLTAIKGFVETLEETVDEKNRHYVEIIKRHTERLVYIVEDLLKLSVLEERETALVLEDVNPAELLRQVSLLFEPRMQEKGLTLTFFIEPNMPSIKADSFQLEQALINLIDNAVKYTERGTVTLSLTRRNGSVVIEVSDTGIGIPDEHLSRIFERFYVVDKSRSKRLGGTGLGLSIVKHIVLLHNGTINVQSTPSQGTTFSISLPVRPL
jgi:two-component system, OmpR family, phosphate regulon sensor histidine kinase PhoR